VCRVADKSAVAVREILGRPVHIAWPQRMPQIRANSEIELASHDDSELLIVRVTVVSGRPHAFPDPPEAQHEAVTSEDPLQESRLYLSEAGIVERPDVSIVRHTDAFPGNG
jgi:hypothetical protein